MANTPAQAHVIHIDVPRKFEPEGSDKQLAKTRQIEEFEMRLRRAPGAHYRTRRIDRVILHERKRRFLE